MSTTALPYTRSEIKDRARETWRGACNVTLPSFSADMSELNGGGIAHDVRRAAELGFWGTLVASECGTTLDEYVEFLEIAAEAAPPDFKLVAHLSFDNVEQELQAAAAAERVGAEAALLSYPPNFVPQSPKDVVDHTTHIAEHTDLALIAFAVMTWGFKTLHPSGFPPDALEQIAKLETVAAVKFEAGGAAMITAFGEAHRRCSQYAIVENPMEPSAFGLMAAYPDIKWIGTSGYEAFGDRVPRVVQAILDDDWDTAMDVFYSYQAGREAKGAFHATFGGANLIHRVGWKYLGWLQGFNGGLLRMPQMRLTPGQMKGLRSGLAASGFDLPPDDSGFYAGRIAS